MRLSGKVVNKERLGNAACITAIFHPNPAPILSLQPNCCHWHEPRRSAFSPWESICSIPGTRTIVKNSADRTMRHRPESGLDVAHGSSNGSESSQPVRAASRYDPIVVRDDRGADWSLRCLRGEAPSHAAFPRYVLRVIPRAGSDYLLCARPFRNSRVDRADARGSGLRSAAALNSAPKTRTRLPRPGCALPVDRWRQACPAAPVPGPAFRFPPPLRVPASLARHGA